MSPLYGTATRDREAIEMSCRPGQTYAALSDRSHFNYWANVFAISNSGSSLLIIVVLYAKRGPDSQLYMGRQEGNKDHLSSGRRGYCLGREDPFFFILTMRSHTRRLLPSDRPCSICNLWLDRDAASFKLCDAERALRNSTVPLCTCLSLRVSFEGMRSSVKVAKKCIWWLGYMLAELVMDT